MCYTQIFTLILSKSYVKNYCKMKYLSESSYINVIIIQKPFDDSHFIESVEELNLNFVFSFDKNN